jgi:putative transposase
MVEYRKGAHTVFEIHLHLVWITKYRRPALHGEVATRLRDLIRDICGQHDVSIMKGHVSKDHVHLLISLPPPEEAVLGAPSVGARLLLL